jgi:lysozyme
LITPRTVSGALILSAAAIVGIAEYEDYRGNAYDDGVGVQTIGFGTTKGVKKGDRIDPVRALVRLEADANRFAQAVKRCAPVPMYQHEYSAWVQFTYNVGESAFCGSTAAKKLNAGDYAGACNEIPKWVYAGGRKLNGLVKRRAAERALCLGANA